jgi:hypothetical protein
MMAILGGLNIRSRLVHVFNDNQAGFEGHTFLEAFDRSRGEWQAQDPDANVYFVDRRTLRRVSTMRLVFGDLEGVTPAAAGVLIRWEDAGIERMKGLYEVVMFDRRREGRNR